MIAPAAPSCASSPTDERVIAIGVDLLRIAAIFQIFDGVQAVAVGRAPRSGRRALPVRGERLRALVRRLPGGDGRWASRSTRGRPGLWWGLTAGLVFVSVLARGAVRRITRHAIARV